MCRPDSISISGLTGLEGDATELYSCSWWKCGMSGDEGCGVEGLVPHSKGVVRPSTDLYDLWRKCADYHVTNSVTAVKLV